MVRCWVVEGFRLSVVVGCRLVGCWLLVVGCRLSVVGWLLVDRYIKLTWVFWYFVFKSFFNPL